jgi:hypothetical protein
VFDGFDLAMVQRHGRIRFIAIVALVVVSAISFSTFGFGPTVETVVFWPIMLIAWVFGDMAAPANIGTPEAPIYEATPVHFFIGLVGFAACLVYCYGPSASPRFTICIRGYDLSVDLRSRLMCGDKRGARTPRLPKVRSVANGRQRHLSPSPSTRCNGRGPHR